MKKVVLLPRLLALLNRGILVGAFMFVGAGAQASNVDTKAGVSAKSTQSYLLADKSTTAQDDQQEKEDSEDKSDNSNDE